MENHLHRSRAEDLDATALYGLLRLRAEIFVMTSTDPEPDGRDLSVGTHHFWVEDPAGHVVATLRLVTEQSGPHEALRIDRLCTKVTARRRGHAHRLLAAAVADAGDRACHITAQRHLEEIYARHGFISTGREYLDDGVSHVHMIKPCRRTAYSSSSNSSRATP